MQLRIDIIQFWASIVPMISMIKWQYHSCYCYHYCYYHHVLIVIIIIIFTMCRFNEYAGFTRFSCHAGFVRLLLDGCYGRWFVYVKQHNATASCWALRAGGTCTLLRTSFVDRNTGRQSIRSGKYPCCSDLSLRGKNMYSMKARFVLLICKLSPGVVTL